MATEVEVKKAMIKALANNPELADTAIVRNGTNDAQGPYVIVGKVLTQVVPSALRAANDFLRYEFVYEVEVECCSGWAFDDCDLAEDSSYALRDAVARAIIIGETDGTSAINSFLPDTAYQVTNVEFSESDCFMGSDVEGEYGVVVILKIRMKTRRA